MKSLYYTCMSCQISSAVSVRIVSEFSYYIHFSGYRYEWKVIPCAESEALRVLWCRNRLSFCFIKFALKFLFLGFWFLSGGWSLEVWIYDFSILTFSKDNYVFIINSRFCYIYSVGSYWFYYPRCIGVYKYISLFGPLGWSAPRYRVFCLSELWCWKKHWLDW